MINSKGKTKKTRLNGSALIDAAAGGLAAMGAMAWPACAADALRPWCLIRTAMRREKHVQAELHDGGWLTYLPMKTDWIGPKDAPKERKRRVRRALFPGYLFAVCLADGNEAAPAEIDGLVAVRRLRDGKLPVVRPRIMLRLLVAEAAGGFDYTREKEKPPKHRFEVGTKVRVLEGPFGTFEACIERVLNEREVQVCVNIFGRATLVTLAGADLEEIVPPEPVAAAA